MRTTLLLAALLCTTALQAQADTLRVGLESDPDALDPDRSRTFVGRIVFTALCDKLFDITPDLEIIPQLATGFTTSDDGLTITMTLREGVTFHDGTPFNAEAVKANIERSQTLDESVRKSELTSIEAVDIIDDLTVQFNLNKPDAPLIAQLADRSGMMMAPSAFEGDFAANPICSGPFQFVSRASQDRIVLGKYEDYWNADEIGISGVSYVIIPDSTVRMANLQSGDIDIANQLAATDASTVANAPGLSFENVTGLGYQGLTFNLANGEMANNPLGQDANVRKAFDLAIDRNVINQIVFDGLFMPASQPFTPSSPYFNPDLPVVERDVDAARALLEEAGVDLPIRVQLQVPNTPDTLQLVQVIQAMVSEVGFEVEIVAKEFATLIRDAGAGDFQISQQGWSGRVDPDGNIHQFVTTGGGFNDGRYSNAEVDELLNAGRVTNDPAQRAELYQQAAAVYSADRPLIYLYHLSWLYGLSDNVQGLTLYPDGMLRLEGVNLAD